MSEIDNITNIESNDTNPADNNDMADALLRMRQNTVSKDQYNKLKDENKKLLDALVDGRDIELPNEAEKPDIVQLRKDLYSADADLTNLEYVTKTLALRQAILDEGGEDPFLPIGTHVTITADMRERAQLVADGLQECVDFADGDSAIFTAQLQRISKDTMPLRRR